MNGIKYSIIIPVYNAGAYLAECIDSILMQDYTSFEIILIDDGSLDNSGTLCDNYAQFDSRISVVHKLNGGLSDSRNVGMHVANGEYIIFVDSDDYWLEKDALNSINKKILAQDTDILIFGMCKTNDEGSKLFQESIPKYCEGYNRQSDSEKMLALMASNSFITSACDKVYSAKYIRDNGLDFVVGQLSEDIEWSAKVIQSNPRIEIIEKTIYVYRMREGGSISTTLGRVTVESIVSVIEKYSTNKNKYLLNFLAQQLVLCLTVSSLIPMKDNEDLIDRMNAMWWLLDYNNYPYVKKVSKVSWMGIKITRMLLGMYKRLIDDRKF